MQMTDKIMLKFYLYRRRESTLHSVERERWRLFILEDIDTARRRQIRGDRHRETPGDEPLSSTIDHGGVDENERDGERSPSIDHGGIDESERDGERSPSIDHGGVEVESRGDWFPRERWGSAESSRENQKRLVSRERKKRTRNRREHNTCPIGILTRGNVVRAALQIKRETEKSA
ncbi:hypothetical protein DY000_02010006 [Brassica cretica]|uniref:NAC domain-containing protein n=1 Tax=Brassica cretica TaxID=69181 RepID=A0ABQ7BZ57_BRACR|nr:hypothetical protein DY000_02010006 [Brassica cretica]